MPEEPIRKLKVPVTDKQKTDIVYNWVRILLVDGPRGCGKSMGCLHKIALHLWEVPAAKFLFLGRSQADVKSAGTWEKLINNVIPYWCNPIDVNTGERFPMMQWIKEPTGGDAGTHKVFFQVRNKHWDVDKSMEENQRVGGVSTCYLDSCYQDDSDFIDDKMKGKEYTGAYIGELTKFQNSHLIPAVEEQLRPCENFPDEYRKYLQIICDTNPDAIHGKRSWVWKMFYDFASMDLDDLDDDQKVELKINPKISPEQYALAIERLKYQQSKLGVAQFRLRDATWQPPQWFKETEARWQAEGPAYFAANVEGEWVIIGDNTTVFGEFWFPNIHIASTASIMGESEMFIHPREESHTIHCGVDMGDSKNSVFLFADEVECQDPSGKMVSGFLIFDEFCYIGEPHTINDISTGVQNKMNFWELNFGVKRWEFWSDTSSTKQRSLSAHNTDQVTLQQISDGRIWLRGVDTKGRDTLAPQIEFIKRLLWEGRIVVSNRCHKLIESIENIKCDKWGKIPKQSQFKHAIDALRYLVITRCRDFSYRQPTTKRFRDEVITQFVQTRA